MRPAQRPVIGLSRHTSLRKSPKEAWNGKKLTFKYDRDGDILYINKTAPYPEQESEELGDEVIAGLNPKTKEIENLEVLFFSTRPLRSDAFELPVSADLRIVGK